MKTLILSFLLFISTPVLSQTISFDSLNTVGNVDTTGTELIFWGSGLDPCFISFKADSGLKDIIITARSTEMLDEFATLQIGYTEFEGQEILLTDAVDTYKISAFTVYDSIYIAFTNDKNSPDGDINAFVNSIEVVPHKVEIDTLFVTDSSSVLVTWDSNTEFDLAGYNVHLGTISKIYNTTDIGLVNSYSTTLSPNFTYFLALSAYDSAGNVSELSEEHSFHIQKSHTGFAEKFFTGDTIYLDLILDDSSKAVINSTFALSVPSGLQLLNVIPGTAFDTTYFEIDSSLVVYGEGQLEQHTEIFATVMLLALEKGVWEVVWQQQNSSVDVKDFFELNLDYIDFQTEVFGRFAVVVVKASWNRSQ